MKKYYEPPIFESIAFLKEDVIRTSGVGEKPVDDNDGSFGDWVAPSV